MKETIKLLTYLIELHLLSPHVPPWRVAGQLYFTFFTFYLFDKEIIKYIRMYQFTAGG
jgi:hypothetical protein